VAPEQHFGPHTEFELRTSPVDSSFDFTPWRGTAAGAQQHLATVGSPHPGGSSAGTPCSRAVGFIWAPGSTPHHARPCFIPGKAGVSPLMSRAQFTLPWDVSNTNLQRLTCSIRSNFCTILWWEVPCKCQVFLL